MARRRALGPADMERDREGLVRKIKARRRRYLDVIVDPVEAQREPAIAGGPGRFEVGVPQLAPDIADLVAHRPTLALGQREMRGERRQRGRTFDGARRLGGGRRLRLLDQRCPAGDRRDLARSQRLAEDAQVVEIAVEGRVLAGGITHEERSRIGERASQVRAVAARIAGIARRERIPVRVETETSGRAVAHHRNVDPFACDKRCQGHAETRRNHVVVDREAQLAGTDVELIAPPRLPGIGGIIVALGEQPLMPREQTAGPAQPKRDREALIAEIDRRMVRDHDPRRASVEPQRLALDARNPGQRRVAVDQLAGELPAGVRDNRVPRSVEREVRGHRWDGDGAGGAGCGDGGVGCRHHSDHDALVTRESRSSLIGDFADDVNGLPRKRVRGDDEGSLDAVGPAETGFARSRVGIGVAPPAIAQGVAIGIGGAACAQRDSRAGGGLQVAGMREGDDRRVIRVRVRQHAPGGAGGEVILQGRGPARHGLKVARALLGGGGRGGTEAGAAPAVFAPPAALGIGIAGDAHRIEPGVLAHADVATAPAAPVG